MMVEAGVPPFDGLSLTVAVALSLPPAATW